MDCYVWIDPFAEIERANQRAAHAREQGRNDVLDYEYRRPGLLQHVIESQAYKLAERVVEEQIKPTFYDAVTAKRIRDASIELLSLTPLKYILPNIEAKTSSRPVYDVMDRDFGVMTEVHMKPFRYAIMDRLA